VEDAAQAIGSKYKGKFSGSIGHVGCFSTHPLKNLNACGDGGFLTTNDEKIYIKAREVRNHGMADRNIVNQFGYVSRMDNLQAAILNYRLQKLDVIIEKRRKNAQLYFETINVEDGINAFFKANSFEEARIVLYSMQINPREKINAFYSSIITSDLDNSTLAKYLKIISKADMLYGKIMKTQNWRLLRYLNDILITLYQNDDRIRYSKYNLSWPLLNRIRWDDVKLKSLSSIMAKKLHLSSSAFVAIGLPYVLFCMKNKTLELELQETFGDIIEKEMEQIP